MNIIVGLCANYLYSLKDSGRELFGVIVFIIVFDILSIRYAIHFYKRLKQEGYL